VKAERGYLALVNRGSVRSQREFTGPVDLTFEWRWRDLAGHPLYSEDFSVALRTSGRHGEARPFLALDGVVVTFLTYPGRISISSAAENKTLAQTADGSFPLAADAWHRVRVTDDGTEVAVYVEGPEVPPGDRSAPAARVRCPGVRGGSHIGLFNREAVAGVPHESNVRNLAVWPLPRCNPE
jgi:hypothetical protein